MSQILSITRKELKAYFGSPMATIFVGTFLLSVLFSFFWKETFFARNIADIRPLFLWMPILMIFLVAALTMRQWSEEQKMGTIELLFTLPVKVSHLVIGKFLAVLGLVAIALFLTLGLPITTSILGNLDWGPVFGGYLGALLMASAYIAIGLFISSKTDNQIVALMMTVLVSGLLYLIGSNGICDLAGNKTGEIFRLIGTGSRFESIERGVIDFRDLAYYLSLAAIFLLLNVLSLEQKRWSCGKNTIVYRRNTVIAAILISLNLLLFNFWLAKIGTIRVDLTANQEYSISEPTRDLISNLREPMILRGYFSEKTHPLLAPLVPRIRDLMTEYQVASDGKIAVSFVDPKFDEEMEAEANQQFGIKPVPFQIAGRYEASVVNSYFNILIKYGDQYVVLGFNDIIEIQRGNSGQLDIGLRNLEYDLTKSIKKVVYGFQSLATVFENINQDMTLMLVATPESLPESYKELPGHVKKIAADLAKESEEKLKFIEINPDDPAGRVSREQLEKQYGIQPQALSFFSNDVFYLYLLLSIGDNTQRIHLSGELGEAEIKKEIEAALKRNSAGFLKTVGIWTPKPAPPSPQMQMYQQQQPPEENYQIFKRFLLENYNITQVDLNTGRVAGDIDVLLVVAPQDLTEMEQLAIDQYLMQGGSIVLLAGNYLLDLSPHSQSLQVKEVRNGVREFLLHHGIDIKKTLAMDMQNEPFPVPVTRDLGGITVQDIKLLDYPYFVDIRQDGMDSNNPVVANLPAVTLNWPSPIEVDKVKNASRTLTTLLQSSPETWQSNSLDIQPDFAKYQELGFAVGDSMSRQNLALSVQGVFSSYFSEKTDPRLNKDEESAIKNPGQDDKENKADKEDKKNEVPPESIIKKSPDSAKVVVVGCSEFVNDKVIGISQSMGQERFLNSLEFLQNIIDWSVEDNELLAIRSRGAHARLLKPLTREEQSFWEWLNYGIAMASLIAITIYGMLRRRQEKPMELV
jgi:ABC-2 type transport system permease protein